MVLGSAASAQIAKSDFLSSPLQLPKYGNVLWDEADVAEMRKRVVDKYVYQSFVFDAKVDAVTSATITSAVIFESLKEGQALFKELKEKGLI